MADRLKLTEATVRDIKPPAKGDQLYFDSELKGLVVRAFAPTRAHPDGAKTFLFSYWVTGAERRLKIGAWPTWSAAAAREEVKGLRKRVDRGEDPAKEKRERREAPTMLDLAKRYEAEWLSQKAEQTQHDDKVMIGLVPHKFGNRITILSALGADRRVAEVHYGDILAMHRAVTESGHPVLANRMRACASRMFSLSLLPMAGEAKAWRDQVMGNPCKGVRNNPEIAKERFLFSAEIAAVVDGLARYGRTSAADCIRLIMLTGARPREAMHAKWQQFDVQPGFWVKPAATTKQRKDHTLPLGAAALELIEDVRGARGEVEPDDYVFPGQIPGQPLKQIRTAWDAVCKHAGLTNVRPYDLRHTFASVGAAGGLSLPLIGLLLGHSTPRTTQRYVHLVGNAGREAANVVTGAIANAGKSGAKVVPLGKRGR